jgi:2,4-dienoyl-CoA reductase-like NADH-dependent reductase (Old Yellow Enzyme family)
MQVPFAEALKAVSSIPISAVGLITSGKQAEEILQAGQADIVSIARHFLRDPSLVLNWAQELDTVVNVPVQYQRSYTRMMTKPQDKK